MASDEQQNEQAPPATTATNVGYVEYVVQMADESGYWRDISKQSAAPRTKRKTLIGKALAEAGVKPEAGMGSLRIRVLDADSAAVHMVPVVVAAPRFDI